MSSERNLLFGVLAVQLKLATPKQLVEAGSVWATDQTKQLGAILVEQGAITTEDRSLLDSLIARQVKAHGGDASMALQTFGGNAAVHQSFAASLVFDSEDGVKYQSIGGSMPQPGPAGGQLLSDEEQLTSEHPGRYTLRGEKGRGGVGRVLIAFDEHVGREIALKELLPESASKSKPVADSPMRRTASLTARFLREARITGQLEHPGIVPVYEVGRRPDQSTYYTMKLVRGETLADRLQRCKGIGDRLKLIPHFHDLCNAIAYAHSRGVVHRDIKPANVMIGEFGETVLLDWGLAKVKGQEDEGAEKLADEIRLLKDVDASDTVEGKPIGTPSYMPPEQADGLIDEIDERSDVWSLGAVLYEILTGLPPYTGSSAYEVIGKVLSEGITPAMEAQKNAPRELAAVAHHCLQRLPDVRYQSVTTLAEDVAAYISGGFVSAYKYSASKIIWRLVRKHWPTLATAAIALVVLAVLSSLAWQQISAEKQAAVDNLAKAEEMRLLAEERAAELLQLNCRLVSQQITSSAVAQLQEGRPERSALLALQAFSYGNATGEVSTQIDRALRDVLDTEYFFNETDIFGNPVYALATSPNNTWVAAGGETGIVRVFLHDRPTQIQFQTKLGSSVRALAFHPKEPHLAIGTDSGSIQVYNVETGKLGYKLGPHSARVTGLEFSLDGGFIASASSDKSVRIWDLATKQELLALGQNEARLTGVALHPVEKIAAICSPGQDVRLLLTEEYKGSVDQTETPPVIDEETIEMPEQVTSEPEPKEEPPQSLFQRGMQSLGKLFSQGEEAPVDPGGENVEGGPPGGEDGNSNDKDEVRAEEEIIPPEAEEEPFRLLAQAVIGQENGFGLATLSKNVNRVSFSPDGQKLVGACTDGSVLLWDLERVNDLPKILKGHKMNVTGVCFDPTSQYIASSSDDNSIRLWDLLDSTSKPVVLSAHVDSVNAVAFSSDGTVLLSAGEDSNVIVWHMSQAVSGLVALGQHKNTVNSLSFSPDGTRLVSSGTEQLVKVWQVDGLSEPITIQDNARALNCIGISPTGNLLVIGNSQRRVNTYSFSGKPKLLNGLPLESAPLCLGFFLGDTQLAVGLENGKLQIFDQTDGKWALNCETQLDASIFALGFLGKSEGLVAGLVNGDLMHLNFTGQALIVAERFEGIHLGKIRSVAINSDKTLFATCGDDRKVVVWDLAKEPWQREVLSAHDDKVSAVAFSPDGKHLLSCSYDGTVKRWDVGNLTRQPVLVYATKPEKGIDIMALAASSQGNLIAWGGRQKTVWVCCSSTQDIGNLVERIVQRNLTLDEWQTFIGSDVPYEKTIPWLPLGFGVPFGGATANDINLP